MSPFLQSTSTSTRVDWLPVETSRRQKDSAQFLQLVMWIRAISFAVVVHKLTSPSTPAISRMDTSKDKKPIESCCIVFQLKVSQTKELQEEKYWPHVFPSTVCRTRIVASSESNSADSVYASKRGIKDHCCDVFQCG